MITFHLISMRKLPGGRQPACGRAGAAECRPWGALAGGDRPSKHKWPWKASLGGHRHPVTWVMCRWGGVGASGGRPSYSLAVLGLSFTRRETQTCQVESNDLKFFGGGWVARCGGECGGGQRAESALWANGKEVEEAWVSSVGESGHLGGSSMVPLPFLPFAPL